MAKAKIEEVIEVDETAQENKEAMPQVTAAPVPKGVTVIMLEDWTPPIVGTWDGPRVLGIRTMKAKAAYVVPQIVAETLLDAKKCIVPNYH